MAPATPARRGGCRHAAGHSNAGGASRHSEAATTLEESVLASLVLIDRAGYTARDDKEAAQVGCLFCKITNGESLESLLVDVPERPLIVVSARSFLEVASTNGDLV